MPKFVASSDPALSRQQRQEIADAASNYVEAAQPNPTRKQKIQAQTSVTAFRAMPAFAEVVQRQVRHSRPKVPLDLDVLTYGEFEALARAELASIAVANLTLEAANKSEPKMALALSQARVVAQADMAVFVVLYAVTTAGRYWSHDRKHAIEPSKDLAVPPKIVKKAAKMMGLDFQAKGVRSLVESAVKSRTFFEIEDNKRAVLQSVGFEEKTYEAKWRAESLPALAALETLYVDSMPLQRLDQTSLEPLSRF